ncbi:MAG: hypothetical protein O2955_15505 [Planctomycetota bacterium]|nr:hypothetical protein [Planctomycetota bacterium]MDA1213920.1 hypothetical protein [Planctomycetota bacterium]
MGFIKKFFKTSTREGQVRTTRSSFENLTEEQLETHLSIARYGDYMLTDAVRPSYTLDVVPQNGYRRDTYTDRETKIDIPVLMVSASSEKLMDIFVDLLDPLGDEVDVVLETSHERTSSGHLDLYREQIELPILKSTLYDFEEMLLNDGCTGIAVMNPRVPLEVQFDEHKLLIVYGRDLWDFEDVLEEHNIPRDPQIKFITEAEHVHSSRDEFLRQFDQLRYSLGIDD